MRKYTFFARARYLRFTARARSEDAVCCFSVWGNESCKFHEHGRRGIGSVDGFFVCGCFFFWLGRWVGLAEVGAILWKF